MGIAIAPALSGGALGRALRGQALVDASWALANRGGGRFDVEFLLGSTMAQYPAWVGGTIIGALAGGALGNPRSLGLDAIFPAFFLGLLVTELRRPQARPVAALGAAMALALTPLTPAGVPIIVAALAVAVPTRSRS
jgi:predicted branched-subunit amino acid permease